MDAIIILCVTLILCLLNAKPEEVQEIEILDRETRLNPEFYVDENAFMEVANALGFGTNDSLSDS